MSGSYVFDPRHAACKSPFGAVCCKQTISFNCRPLLSELFCRCTLVLYHEFSGKTEEIPMTPVGPEDTRFRFTTQITAPETPELTWYHFRFERHHGGGCILDKSGYRTGDPVAPWQLTTYLPNDTPEWFGGGITYQIFPDRFRRTAIPSPEGMPGNRWVHTDWTDAPAWRPDPDGEVRNRDFFGGSFSGMMEKLDDLAALGVTTIYLCPIFESASNHRYNTATYEKIDPMLGTEEDFRAFCEAVHTRGMKVMLDGVFNHTGSQSIYFNDDGYYPSLGAAQSKDSPYYDWFRFKHWPDDYDSWWGIKTLPAVREEAESYVKYIIEDENSIVRRWLRAGADGWRLDVADELPDWFIERCRKAVVDTKPDAFLLGEVWEDASNKIAYDQRRSYLLGRGLHSVMNYPFRTALLNWLKGGAAIDFLDAMETLRENYPPAAFSSTLNFLGTHDTARILTVLGADEQLATKEARSTYRLSAEERNRGMLLLRLAALVLYAFPGSPMIYYGDEAGMEGWEDPFNRGTYPWGQETPALVEYFKKLGTLRKEYASLQHGLLRWLTVDGAALAFTREYQEESVICAVNGGTVSQSLTFPCSGSSVCDLLTGKVFPCVNGLCTLTLPPHSGYLFV